MLRLVLLLLVGCGSYVGSARPFAPARLAEPGWIAVRGVPFVAQRAESDCGAAAIAMVVGYWTGAPAAPLADTLRPAPRDGIRAARLRDLARSRGLASFLVQGSFDDLARELGAGRPVLVGLVKPHRRNVLTHYEIVVGWHPKTRTVVTLDPAAGWRANSFDGFVAEWQPARWLTLIVASR